MKTSRFIVLIRLFMLDEPLINALLPNAAGNHVRRDQQRKVNDRSKQSHSSSQRKPSIMKA
jgi:hypothetical protein